MMMKDEPVTLHIYQAIVGWDRNIYDFLEHHLYQDLNLGHLLVTWLGSQ